MDTSSSAAATAKASTSNATIESYMLLANGVRGAAVVGLIQQVIAANNLYVFGEILDHANVQAAKEVCQIKGVTNEHWCTENRKIHTS